MNYLHILFIVVVVCIVMYYWKGRGEGSVPYQEPHTEYHPRMLGDMGFVKPEHKLRKIFESMSSGTKVKLGGVCEEIVYDNRRCLLPCRRESFIWFGR